MNLEWLGKIFDDEKTLAVFIKASLLVGPGILAIAYFQRPFFIEIDWLKLLSLSILFSGVLVLPLMITAWFLSIAVILFYESKMSRLIKRSNKQKIRSDRNLEKLASLEVSDEIAGEVKKLEADIKKLKKDIQADIRKQTDFKEEIYQERRKRKFFTVVQQSWFSLLTLFGLVILCISANYFWHFKHMNNLHDLLSFLFITFYLFLPLIMVGSWGISSYTYFSKHKSVKMFIRIFFGAVSFLSSYYLIMTFIQTQ